jgi:hypothetical protein
MRERGVEGKVERGWADAEEWHRRKRRKKDEVKEGGSTDTQNRGTRRTNERTNELTDETRAVRG